MREEGSDGVRTQIPGRSSPSSGSPSSCPHAGCLFQGEREIVRELLHRDGDSSLHEHMLGSVVHNWVRFAEVATLLKW